MRRRLFIVSAILAGVVLAYAALVPSQRSTGQEPWPTTGAERTSSPQVTATSTSESTPIPPGRLPELLSGLTGELTYRTDREEVTVGFPSGAAIAQGPMSPIAAFEPSADGLWATTTDCSTICRSVLNDLDGNEREITIPNIAAISWSPEGHTLALTGGPSDGGYPASNRLMSIDEFDAPPRVLYETRKGLAHPFAWLSSGELLIADNGESDARLVRVAASGAATTIATVPSTVWYLYASPDGTSVAFTQNSPEGWELWTVDGATGDVRNAGNMGSDPAGITPPQESAPVREKGPMYIAWSPEGTKVAFGGGYEPPYTVTIADIVTGAKHRVEFPDGYPGELKWSPDGTKLAVSSYNLPRTKHESYVVDPETGVARHVLSGCVIIWSPDSRFLAIHGEREPGVALVDVETLERAQLTHMAGDTPLRWMP